MIAILIILMLIGCARKPTDSSLVRVQEMIDDAPHEALDSLEAINPSSLSDRDRHLYDLLTVKAQDKAYIRHTSDSLILDVIDYYKSHKSLWLYPEALYYGARVYSDLGDYPTALKYFQDALEALGKNPDNLDLEANIASQYARLLTNLRLYDEAIPYMEKALEIDRIKKDSVNEVYDLQLLGDIRKWQGEFKLSEGLYSEALAKSRRLPNHLQAKSKMMLASVWNETGKTGKALNIIRDVPNQVKSVARNRALAVAANIYYSAGILDTAYMYARQLISGNDENNKISGYAILLSPEVIRFTEDSDTLGKYVISYRDIIESMYDDNENQMALMQQSLYNYRLHVQEKEQGQKRNLILTWILLATAIIILSLVILVIFQKSRISQKIRELQEALDKANTFEAALKNGKIRPDVAPDLGMMDKKDIPCTPKTESELRKELRMKLLRISERYDSAPPVAQSILKSESHSRLQDKIASKEPLQDNDALWKEIEKTVLECSPAFKKNLLLLAGGKLSSYDMKTALLMKFGVTTSEMAHLFGRVKGTIVSRKASLCERVFDEKLGTQKIEWIIRLL